MSLTIAGIKGLTSMCNIECVYQRIRKMFTSYKYVFIDILVYTYVHISKRIATCDQKFPDVTSMRNDSCIYNFNFISDYCPSLT